MTRLRGALEDLAAEAPPVSLADAAMAGHRRRRRARLAVGAVATVAALTVTMAGAVAFWPRAADTATTQDPETAPDLPGPGVKVGRISHAYQTPCDVDAMTRRFDCDAVRWRVVTRDGKTYGVPQALVSSRDDPRAPVAISRDGRLLAYYSSDAGTHVIRDLVGGGEVISPVPIAADRIGTGSMLAISDDGRHLAFDPREGSKDPGLLIDVRTGRTTRIPGAYEVVGVKDGTAALVRYVKTDLWLMPVTGGGRPVRFDGRFIMFSEVAPDGRTVVAVDHPELNAGKLTVLDARTGRTVRKLSPRGLPADGHLTGTGTWLSRTEVMIFVRGREHPYAYAVDVTTGQARRLAGYAEPQRGGTLTLPGVNGSLK